MVFNACVDLNSDNCDTPRVLSQVCHHWRTFFLSSPNYWTAVKMQCGGAEGDHHWTKMLLERSQDHPITFHLCIAAHFRRDEVKNVLYRHAGRVNELIIDSDVDVSPTAVWREFQLFISEDLQLFDYSQKDDMRITTVRDVSSLSFVKSYPFQLPLTGGIDLNWGTRQMRVSLL